MTLSEDNFRHVTPYTPGEQPQVAKKIKLNTNENPYPPSPKVQALLTSFAAERLRLYPDPDASRLTEALASYYGVKEEEVFTGVGSDEVLSLAFLAFFNSGKKILFPDITYSFYPVWANLFHIPCQTVPLLTDFALNAKSFTVENGGIVFPNPNAPTSRLEPLSLVEEILSHNPQRVVIVDEAYIDFAKDGASAVSLLPAYENLLITGTFSKSRALAGLRIGFALGSRKLIRELKAVKNAFNSYTVNTVSLLCGIAALQDEAYFQTTIGRIRQTREEACEHFRRLGFTFPKPSGNFIFVKHPAVSAKALFACLRERHIYVRHFDTPQLKDYLRVSVGTKEEMDAFFSAVEAYTACF